MLSIKPPRHYLEARLFKDRLTLTLDVPSELVAEILVANRVHG